jgi:alkanesulfonate monooxygenase SsuD/methylene tetrahydromethanopterin reductase-like flavin-dependent oxidoreductase (luciferase family)
MAMDVGVGLWGMRSTSSSPAGFPVLYRDLLEDARRVEELGFHSLWLSEHHFWYDGWCPALLVAAGAALGATTTLHLGTGVLILPLHDPERVAAAVQTLESLAPGRLELGFGLGYRDAELDALGISRKRRGRRVEETLDLTAGVWDGPPRAWVGGIAERSLRRAGERGLGLFLPSSMRPAQLADVIARAHETAEAAGNRLGPVGVLKDTWLTGPGDDEDEVRRRLTRGTHEYAGSWWLLQGRLGFDAPDLLEAQMRRSRETSFVGPPDAIRTGIQELEAAGVDLVVLQVRLDAERTVYREQLESLASEVLP